MSFIKVKDEIIVGRYRNDAPELYKVRLGMKTYFCDSAKKLLYDPIDRCVITKIPPLKCKVSMQEHVKLEYVGTTMSYSEISSGTFNELNIYKGWNEKQVLMYDEYNDYSLVVLLNECCFRNDVVEVYHLRPVWVYKNYLVIGSFGFINTLTGETYRMRLTGVDERLIKHVISDGRFRELGRLIKASEVIPYIGIRLNYFRTWRGVSNKVKLEKLIAYMHRFGMRPILTGESDAVYRLKQAYKLALSDSVLPEYQIDDFIVHEIVTSSNGSVTVTLDNCVIWYYDKIHFIIGDVNENKFKFFTDNSLCDKMSDDKEEEVIKHWAVFLRKIGCDKVKILR